jgi:penicillin-binding protein 1B
MTRALAYREYRDTKPFRAPTGIVSIDIDPETGFAATAACPKRQAEVYIAGTEPVATCALHGGRPGITTVAGWDTAPAVAPAPPVNTAPKFTGTGGDGVATPDSAARRAARQAAGQGPPPPGPLPDTNQLKQDPPKKEPKKGLFQRIIGVFK